MALEPWYAKVWKSVAALATVLALLSPTSIRIHWIGIVFVTAVTIALAFYWHFVEWGLGAYRSMRVFILEMRDDIRTIKRLLEEMARETQE